MTIRIEGVSKYFGRFRALEALSLTLPARTSTVIYGPSGSGKTTLLRLIAGLEVPSQGQITIGGELASTPDWVRPPHQRDVGFVFQDPALWPHLTVAQNVGFGILDHPKREVRQRVDAVLSALDLTGMRDRHPNQLSGGQARRVALARTLIVNPRYLLLDEPLTHLQPALKWELFATIIHQVADMGITLLYVTHNREEARRLHGRQIELVDGRIESDSEPARPSRDHA
jgi:ABC-type sulfate/molybdate transport systems ATPase subunit